MKKSKKSHQKSATKKTPPHLLPTYNPYQKKQRAKPWSKTDYWNHYKEIKDFVSIKHTKKEIEKGLTPYEMRRVKKYYSHVHALLNRPHEVFRTRDKKKLKTAQKFSRQRNFKYINCAIIPTDGKKAKIKFNKKGEMTVKMKKVTEHFVPLDEQNLALDAKKEVFNKTAHFPSNTMYRVNAGEYMIFSPVEHRESVMNSVAELVAKYGHEYGGTAPKHLQGKENKWHYYGDWLNGLTAYTFTDQKDFREWNQKLTESRKADKEQKRKARNHAKYLRRKERGEI